MIGPDLGTAHGPKDLSSNKKHRAGYGRSRMFLSVINE
jgi:hypothetical protein